jgi:hypothetical protein
MRCSTIEENTSWMCSGITAVRPVISAQLRAARSKPMAARGDRPVSTAEVRVCATSAWT